VTKIAGTVQGKILKQSPPAGARVSRGARIALTVSVKSATGWRRPPTPAKPQVIVPNVVGMSHGQAKRELKKLGLDTGTISRKKMPGARRGRIATQTPAAGTKADKGSKVNLVFAK
jgi:serine/threonine-protein kinase